MDLEKRQAFNTRLADYFKVRRNIVIAATQASIDEALAKNDVRLLKDKEGNVLFSKGAETQEADQRNSAAQEVGKLMLTLDWHVGDVVRKLRLRRGWSHEDLARYAKLMSRPTVAKLERDGMAGVSARSLERIAEALGTTVADLDALVPSTRSTAEHRIAEQMARELLKEPTLQRTIHDLAAKHRTEPN